MTTNSYNSSCDDCLTIQESPMSCYNHILVPKVTADTPGVVLAIDLGRSVELVEILNL